MSKYSTAPYTFEKSFDDAQDTRFMGLHTSGTSGHPKPIYWTNLALTTIPSCLDRSVRDHDGNGSNLMKDLFQGNNILLLFPLSHVSRQLDYNYLVGLQLTCDPSLVAWARPCLAFTVTTR